MVGNTNDKDYIERKREILNECLRCFVKKGLYETSVRDLSSAVNLQTAGIYYYFANKDDVVIACSEEAAVRLEASLILPAIDEIDNPDVMISELHRRANEMSPMMKFFIQVCATPHYEEKMRPVLTQLSERHDKYVEEIAEKLTCNKEEVMPVFNMCVTAVTNYMIFGEEMVFSQQMDIVKDRMEELSKPNEQSDAPTME